MPKTTVNPDSLFNSLQYGFSQIAIGQGSRTVWIAGQVAWDADGQIVGAGDLAAQVERALANLDTAVRAAGGTLADVVSLRIYIAEAVINESAPVRDGLRAWFPADPPAATWIGVPALANPEFLVEIEAIAVLA